MADLLPIADAQAIIRAHTRMRPPMRLSLDKALGLVLAEDAVSDLDVPPFDKAMMDGYAVRAADVARPEVELTIIEEVTAGKVPQRTLGPGQATRIMTGAPVPQGADAVVMIERTTTIGNDVKINDVAKAGQNIMPRAKEMRRGETVLQAGVALRPQEIGVLAMVGRHEVLVHSSPTVAIVPTGDEVVDVSATPGPGQIRNSNGLMLHAQAVRAGARADLLGIARDNESSLRESIGAGFRYDALILSGGVSAGKLDLVPGILAEFGVKALFHKVAMKPGKPMLFGVKDHGTERPPTYVFGLPGNPVSSFVCFELFVRPALRQLMALPPGPKVIEARLTHDFPHRTDRPTYHPANLDRTPEGWTVSVVPWIGSSDLRGLLAGNALVVLPVGEHQHRTGQMLPVMLLE